MQPYNMKLHTIYINMRNLCIDSDIIHARNHLISIFE